jgi:hypothetical protein
VVRSRLLPSGPASFVPRPSHVVKRSVPHLKVSGKGDKTRYLPLHPSTNSSFTSILTPPGMARMRADRSFGRSKTIALVHLRARSPLMGSTDWYAAIQRSWALRSAPMPYGRLLPPMRSITRPISPKSRSGWDMPISRRPASTITVRPGLRIARRSR